MGRKESNQPNKHSCVNCRAAKRPARYYSSEDEDELLDEETPKKKGTVQSLYNASRYK